MPCQRLCLTPSPDLPDLGSPLNGIVVIAWCRVDISSATMNPCYAWVVYTHQRHPQTDDLPRESTIAAVPGSMYVDCTRVFFRQSNHQSDPKPLRGLSYA